MSEITFAKDSLPRREAVLGAMASKNHMKRHGDELSGLVTDLANANLLNHKLRLAVDEMLAECRAAGIEVISAVPEWVELRMPCELAAITPLEKLLAQLDADLPQQIGEPISYACHEMLSNAIEYGGRLNPAERVEIRFVRFKRAIVCRIKDPGEGFDPARLAHAAINNPNDDPLQHVLVREEKCMRPGGFGILLTSQLVDELVYNERHNELLFVKYLS